MISREFAEQAGPWNVLPIISDVRSIATSVSRGSIAGADPIDAPESLLVFDDLNVGQTVDQVTCSGLTLIIMWIMRQKGPGSREWPGKLQGWMDDWENDFGSGYGGDERAAYADLVTLLDKVDQSIERSLGVIQ